MRSESVPTWLDGHVLISFVFFFFRCFLKDHCCGKKALETMHKVRIIINHHTISWMY